MPDQEDRIFHEWLSQLEGDHVTTLRQIRRVAITTQKMTREICGVACVYARRLDRDAPRRREFYTEAFPYGFQRFNRSKLLLHVLMYFYGVNSSKDAQYRTASAHSVALREIYSDVHIADDDVVRHIEVKGIYAEPQSDEVEDGEAEGAEMEDGRMETAVPEGAGIPAHDASPRRSTKSRSVFSDTDFNVAGEDEEAEGVAAALDAKFPGPQRVHRKPPKPAVVLKRLPRREIERCILARPRNGADREAILGALLGDKKVWVRLEQGERWDYEFVKGGGKYLDVPISEYRIEDA